MQLPVKVGKARGRDETVAHVGSRWIRLCLVVLLGFGSGHTYGYPTIWEGQAEEFTQQSGDGSFDCSGCHAHPNKASLVMTAPSQVDWNATDVDLAISGLLGSGDYAYWQYQASNGGDGALIKNARTNKNQTIAFDVNDASMTIRYCLLDAKATDRFWNCGTRSVTRKAKPNAPPTITSTKPSNLNVVKGSAPFNFTVSATDDSPGVILSVKSQDTGVVAVNSSAAPSFSLSFPGAGSTSVVISATDGDGLKDTQTFLVTVTEPVIVPADLPPTITSANPGNQTLTTLSGGFVFSVTATDDNSTPEVSVTSSSQSVVSVVKDIFGGYRLIPVSVGSSKIVIKATDSKGQTDIQSFAVKVVAGTIITDPPVNEPPVLVLTGSISGMIDLTVGDIHTIGVDVTDEEPDTLVFSSSSSNAAVATASYSAPGQWVIDAHASGSATLKLTVKDSALLQASVSVDVVVTIVNESPVAQPDTFVVSVQGQSVSLDVLANDSDGNGDALSIVLDAGSSSQGNAIAVSGNKVTYQVAGALTSDDFFTYRAADSRGALSDSVRVTLTPSDQDGDGAVDANDNCPELPNPDQGDMDSDGTGDLCDVDPDGDGLPGISGIPFESGRELAESDCLACHLTGASGAPLFMDEAAWNARISEAGGEPEDLLGSVLNGKGAMPAYASTYSTQDLLQAILYLSGREGSPGGSVDLDLDGVPDSTDNCSNVPNPDQIDSDANGTGDVCEPLADRDGDGYPFKLDDDDGNASRLPANLPVVTNSTVFTGAGTLRLGRVAYQVAETSSFDQAAVVLSSDSFAQGVSQVFPGISTDPDSRFVSLMGVINLDLVFTSSSDAEVIIHLGTNLPLNPAIRVFDTDSGLWRDFSTGASGELASAPATSSGCPVSSSANYQEGLAAGLPCLRVRVQDGGVNDADGVIDGRAELMINIVRGKAEGSDDSPPTVDTNPSKSGGGSTGLWLLCLILVRLLSAGIYSSSRRLCLFSGSGLHGHQRACVIQRK